MTVQIIRGNALALPLADNSVDLVVTSPPYFGLRSYQDGGEHYSGQIGDEPTPAEFVDALIAATAEMVRCVKPSGSIFVNLGDKYAAAGGGGDGSSDGSTGRGPRPARRLSGIPAKSLIGIPWRYALRCIDDLGLILRAEVIWSKPNGLPESVTDRVRRSHEQWFHFTLAPRYYSAVDEIREAHVRSWGDAPNGGHAHRKAQAGVNAESNLDRSKPNPLGKLPGSVWTTDRNALHDNVVGLVLQAVASGHLTPEEGERILCAGRNDSGPRSTSPASAGGGSASSLVMATGDTGAPEKETGERTDSPTSSSRGRSVTGSTSTTSVATSGASTPTTSSLSPSQRTTPDAHGRTDAPTGTPSTSGTPTSAATASENAEPACETECASDAPPSVWVIPTEPLHVPEHVGVDHFAAFPTEWPRRIIQGWSPAGVCVDCGEGRRPVVERGPSYLSAHPMPHPTAEGGDLRKQRAKGQKHQDWKNAHPDTLSGYACACPEPTAPTRPSVVLDPFGGTGTTALVADALGRDAIHVDMSADYCRLATWRTNDPKQRAKAARKPFTPPAEQNDGQLDLLEGIA